MPLEIIIKGPSFIEEEKCQERLKTMSAKNANMKDLEEFEEYGVDIDSIYEEDYRRLKDTILYRLTFNGQIFWPKKWLRKGPAAVAHDWFYNPQRQCLVDSVIAIIQMLIQQKSGNWIKRNLEK